MQISCIYVDRNTSSFLMQLGCITMNGLITTNDLIKLEKIPSKSYSFRTNDPSKLIKIFEPRYSIGVWMRDQSKTIEMIDTTILPKTFSIAEIVKANDPCIDEIVKNSLGVHLNKLWIQDIEFLIELYSDLLGVSKIGFRFAGLQSAMCPKFHVDYVGIRLLCTYLGPGTEYLENNKFNRLLVQKYHGIQQPEPNGKIKKANPMDIVLLKGENWFDNKNHGAIHRSPQISNSESRYMISLDAIYGD
jgi:hypothetical protein